MVKRLSNVQVQMHRALQCGDTSSYWSMWSECVQKGMLDAMDIDCDHRHAYRGHGEPHFTMCDQAPFAKKAGEAVAKGQQSTSHKALKLRRCVRRLRHLAALARIRKFGEGAEWPHDVLEVFTAVRKQCCEHACSADCKCLMLCPHHSGWHRVVLAATLDAKQFEAMRKQAEAKYVQARRKAFADKMQDGKSLTAKAYGVVGKPQPHRVAFVKG